MIYRNGYGPIDRFCAKHPRFGISNLMLYIVIGQVAVFILDLFFRGMLSSYWLPFSRDLILHGQVWRLVTFIFLPSDSGNPFFLLLGCYFYFTWPFWGAKLGVLRRRADPKVVNFKRVQKQAQKQAKATGGYRHKCAVCGITDADDPNMEFRYCSKCDGYYCYCMNHINNHVHIHHD